MPHLTREDITITLGDLDDTTIAEIRDTGADAGELALAASLVRDGELHLDHTGSAAHVLAAYDVIDPIVVEPEYDYDSELPFTD